MEEQLPGSTVEDEERTRFVGYREKSFACLGLQIIFKQRLVIVRKNILLIYPDVVGGDVGTGEGESFTAAQAEEIEESGEPSEVMSFTGGEVCPAFLRRELAPGFRLFAADLQLDCRIDRNDEV